MLNKREAKRAGRDAGIAAASWKFDGNTDDATYSAFLRGSRDGDPAVMDAYQPPSWLSGEWAGESISELLGDSSGDCDRDDEIANIYEDAANMAYWNELERIARYHTKER